MKSLVESPSTAKYLSTLVDINSKKYNFKPSRRDGFSCVLSICFFKENKKTFLMCNEIRKGKMIAYKAYTIEGRGQNMFIYIQDEVLEFDNDPKIIEKMLTTINERLDEKELRFSNLIVDGIPIYGDFYNYFAENIEEINKVEVVLLTTTDLVNESIITANDYISNAIPLLTQLAEEFYQQPNKETWTKLNDLFEGVQWIIESLTQIDSIKNLSNTVNDYKIWNEYVQGVSKLSVIIPELESAIIGKDIISIGDMLLYEIKPIFQGMFDKLQFLLPGLEDGSVS